MADKTMKPKSDSGTNSWAKFIKLVLKGKATANDIPLGSGFLSEAAKKAKKKKEETEKQTENKPKRKK